MSKMVPEVKALLLDALKSGEYEKVTGVLKRDKMDGVGYCCLGVLSDIASKAGVCEPFVRLEDGEGGFEEWWAIEEDETDSLGYTFLGRNTAFLPDSVRVWSGLDGETQTTLASINDGSAGFGEVIEYIETNL